MRYKVTVMEKLSQLRQVNCEMQLQVTIMGNKQLRKSHNYKI